MGTFYLLLLGRPFSPHNISRKGLRGARSRDPTSSPEALLPTSDNLPLCTHTQARPTNGGCLEEHQQRFIIDRNRWRYTESHCTYVAAAGAFRGAAVAVCLAPTHFVYRETDAFLHKALYNAAPSKRIRGLLFHCVSEEVMGRVRQATDRYQILKCVFL